MEISSLYLRIHQIKNKKTYIMKLLKIIVLGSLLIAMSLSSCQKKNRMANHQIVNSIDSYSGWIINKNLIKTGEAHSGNKYVSLGKNGIYGPRYTISVAELGGLKKVNVDCFARIYEENAKELYVFRIMRGDSGIYWKAYDLRDADIIQGKWTQINTSFDFEKVKVEPEDMISIFPWSPDKIKADFDDITIEFK